MFKIAICDDDRNVCSRISLYVNKYIEEINRPAIIKLFYSGKELLNTSMHFDIIFLDIEMPEMDGIETAKRIRYKDVNSKIIYITNYANYWEKAYEVHAFDYLDKPIQNSMIQKVIQDAIYYFDNAVQPQVVSFQTEDGVISTSIDDIYYFEYSSRKTKIVTSKGNFRSNYTLKQIVSKFEKYNFISPHKSFVVNLLYIKLIKGFDILMDNDDIVPLAQKKAVEFKRIFNDFLQSTFDRI